VFENPKARVDILEKTVSEKERLTLELEQKLNSEKQVNIK